MSELLGLPGQELIPVEKVLSLQALAIGVISEQARRVTSNEDMTGYVLFDNSRGAIGSGLVDTYMSVITRQPDLSSWQLTISFLTMVNTHELRYSNTRELYRLGWDNEGKCAGAKTVFDNLNPVVGTVYDIKRGFIDTIVPKSGDPEITPLDIADCDILADRMQTTALQVSVSRQGRRAA